MSNLTNNSAQQAIKTNYTALLNCYLREFKNWSRYLGIPKYDAAIAKALQPTDTNLHIRIDFSSIGCDMYIPLKYYSESERHLFHFPVIKRDLKTDEILEVSITDFLNLAAEYAKTIYPNIDADIVQERLLNSISNLEKYLDYAQENDKTLNNPAQSFIEAEQSLLLGHIMHPVPKAKQGFDDQDLLKYSSETSGKFQLFYFLINPENITEKNADGDLVTTELYQQISPLLSGNEKEIFGTFPDYRIVPMHPWEAKYLLGQKEVQEMQAENNLFPLGEYGEFFTPTSSTRTLYNADSDWMFKFSLHVKITNSERINLFPELHRGHDISRLLKTQWGKDLRKEFTEIDFIVDPAFISVSHKGKVINGFNTSIRRNPFKAENKNKNVSLLAALCQDAVLGEKSRLQNLIVDAAKKLDKSVEQTAVDWFKQYLHLSVKPMVGILNKYGLACEFHQQNVMVELDNKGFPAKIYFRDNQGFFIREGRKDMVSMEFPGFAEESQSIIDEADLAPKYTYYFLVNNILGIINAFGSQQLADERKLIDLVYKEFKKTESEDKTGWVDYILNKRSWETKANFITSLQNLNEADESMEYPAVFLETPNPLSTYFFCDKLIRPSTEDTVYSRFFEEEGVTIGIRPFDMERDFEMVHEWFNREHAKPYWKMDGPKRELELWFRTILPSDETHSFIGEVNGVPNFCFEPYWPMRDLVGGYYDAHASDYGTHFFVAPREKDKKFSLQSFKVALDYIFLQAQVGVCIGEASVEAVPTARLIKKLGYSTEGILKMPHKMAYLTFCSRESYSESCSDRKPLVVVTD